MNIEKRQNGIKRLTVIAMFCALAYATMLLIKIPIQFLDLDVKDSVMILCGLLFGPISAVAISVIVPLVQLVTISGTGVYGLIMNVLSSLSFAVVASLIYKYKKSFYGAIVGLISGVIAMTAIMMVANLFITPYYMHVPTAQVAALIPTLLLPFNLVKGVLNAAIVLLLYKPLSNVLKKSGIIKGNENGVMKNTITRKRNVIVPVVSACIIVLSLAIIFFVLKA